MIHDPKSAALAVKLRSANGIRAKRRADVAEESDSVSDESSGEEEDESEEGSSTRKKTAVIWTPTGPITGGKATKTGMVLARAQLVQSSSAIQATRDRQNAMLSKGAFRCAEKVGREAAVGTLRTASKPIRPAFEDKETHRKAFGDWMKTTLQEKVREQLFEPTSCASEGAGIPTLERRMLAGEAGEHRCHLREDGPLNQ